MLFTLNKQFKNTYIWLLVSVLCALFSLIYETFSFGVISLSMVLMFIYPLLLGAIPSYLLERYDLPNLNKIYIDGIVVLTIRSLIVGILEIYGTTTSFSKYYLIIGIALLVIGATMYLINYLSKDISLSKSHKFDKI